MEINDFNRMINFIKKKYNFETRQGYIVKKSQDTTIAIPDTMLWYQNSHLKELYDTDNFGPTPEESETIIEKIKVEVKGNLKILLLISSLFEEFAEKVEKEDAISDISLGISHPPSHAEVFRFTREKGITKHPCFDPLIPEFASIGFNIRKMIGENSKIQMIIGTQTVEEYDCLKRSINYLKKEANIFKL